MHILKDLSFAHVMTCSGPSCAVMALAPGPPPQKPIPVEFNKIPVQTPTPKQHLNLMLRIGGTLVLNPRLG